MREAGKSRHALSVAGKNFFGLSTNRSVQPTGRAQTREGSPKYFLGSYMLCAALPGGCEAADDQS